jgi:hypothetical protein
MIAEIKSHIRTINRRIAIVDRRMVIRANQYPVLQTIKMPLLPDEE